MSEILKKTSFSQKKKFSPLLPQRSGRIGFWHPRCKNLDHRLNFYPCPTQMENHDFLQKNCYPSEYLSGHVETSSESPPKTNWQKPKINPWHNLRKWYEETTASKNIFCLKMFFLTRKMQFWQTFRWKTWRRPKIFFISVQESSIEKSVKKIYS